MRRAESPPPKGLCRSRANRNFKRRLPHAGTVFPVLRAVNRALTGENFPFRRDDASAASARIGVHPPRFDAITRQRAEHARRLCRRTVVLLSGQAAWFNESSRAGARGGARAATPRCVSILTITTGSSIAALIFRLPPHAQRSMSILNKCWGRISGIGRLRPADRGFQLSNNRPFALPVIESLQSCRWLTPAVDPNQPVSVNRSTIVQLRVGAGTELGRMLGLLTAASGHGNFALLGVPVPTKGPPTHY